MLEVGVVKSCTLSFIWQIFLFLTAIFWLYEWQEGTNKREWTEFTDFSRKWKKGTTEIATVGCLDLTAKLVLIYWQYYSNVTQPKQNKLLELVCLCLWKIRAKTRINSKKKKKKNSEEMVEKWSFICFRVLLVMRWLLGLYWFLHPHCAQ